MHEEAKIRLDRRLVGQMAARTAEMDFEDKVSEPRTKLGNIKLSIRRAVTAVAVGMCAGCKGFAELEQFTTAMGTGARRALLLPKRLPDTTVGDLVARLNPEDLRQVLYQQVRLAVRRKQLAPDLPLNVASLDGKYSTTFVFDAPDAAVRYGQVSKTGQCKVGTVTACLISTACRPCIDACPVPPQTNEMGIYIKALDDLRTAYGERFLDVVMYDAGGAGLANATATVERGLDYIFCLNDFQPTMHAVAIRLLGSKALETADATTTDLDGGEVVVRHIWLSDKMAGWLDWTHLRTIARVYTARTDKTTGDVTTANHYYISSLGHDRLNPGQWLTMLRRRWSVENQNHNTFDKILREDTRPWLKRPQGMVTLMMIRRLVYNILTIYRSVTTRSERKRAQPWRDLMRQIYDAVIRATAAQLAGLRRRNVVFG